METTSGSRHRFAPVALVALLGGTACYGGVERIEASAETDASDASGSQGGDSADSGPDDDGIPPGCDPAEAITGSAPLRRLTHWEYDNTIRDLLGDTRRLGEGFPTEASGTTFDNRAAALGVSSLQAEEYMRAAEDLAAQAVTDLDTLLPCDIAEGQTCAEAFIEEFAVRAFRRPLTDAQRQRLLDQYVSAAAAEDSRAGIELVLQAVLQSPYFLYRVEMGMPDADPDADAVRLDGWEMASRLSYLLWGSMPDDALFTAAANGDLDTMEGVEAQTLRMLDDPRAREAVAKFHRQWLRLDDVDTMNKDAAVISDLDADLRDALRSGTLAYLDHVIFEGQGDLATILTAPFAFVNDDLAPLYGVPAPGSSEPIRVDLPVGERAGLLTQPSVLAITSKPNQTSPVGRGTFVQSRILCTTLPEPPPDVDTTPPEVDPSATTRERYEQHVADPACASCHTIIDPIGFALENYDAMGRWRDDEFGLAIDASGVLNDEAFDGPIELSAMLSDQPGVRECFVEQWFTYAHGRAPESEDACSVQTLEEAFEASGQDVQTLLLELTRVPSFRYRPANGGS